MQIDSPRHIVHALNRPESACDYRFIDHEFELWLAVTIQPREDICRFSTSRTDRSAESLKTRGFYARFVSNLTAAMLLVHALVGCCWHHDHAVPAANKPRLAIARDRVLSPWQRLPVLKTTLS